MSLSKFRLSSKHKLIVALAFATSLSSAPAFAQLPTNASEAAQAQANPGRVQERMLEQDDLLEVSPKIEVQDLVLQQVPEGAENIRFQLNSIELEGVSAYDANDLRPSYDEFLGQTITLTDVYAISTRLTNKYRNDGYILTQVVVPPQTIDGGNVKLRAVEGYISSVNVTGDLTENEASLIRGYASNIQVGQTLNARTLERYLLLINDLPGLRARSVLTPSPTETGGADLQIIVERKMYEALVSIDNYGSRYLGPIQISASGSLNSILGNNERITAQAVIAPDHSIGRELLFLGLGYAQPINTIGTEVEFFTSVTDTEPGYNLDQFDVKGKSNYYSAKITHPFIRSRATNLDLYAMFDWRDVESKNNLEATREDRIRAARAGLNYQFLDNIWRAGVNSINVELAQGLNIFGASEEDDTGLTRPNADPQFTKISADIQSLQNVANNVNVLLAASGQLASDALLSSEEFGVGGVNIGRAFDGSEIIGDDGLSGKVEVQWNDPMKVDFVQNYQLYTFFDAGTIWNKDATSSSTKTDTITSTGLGIRAEFPAQTQAAFGVAWPLNRDVEAYGDDDPRFYASLSKRF